MEQIILAAGPNAEAETYFSQIPGVVAVLGGSTGGSTENPSDAEVKSHATGHVEALLVEYDTTVLSTTDLLKVFFLLGEQTKDPDETSDAFERAIYYVTDAQRTEAEDLIAQRKITYPSVQLAKLEQAGPFYETDSEDLQ